METNKLKIDNEEESVILLVDDDQSVLESSKMWLNSEGFMVHTASNQEEALKIVDQHQIDVALVDFRLGSETGIEINEAIKQIDDTVKVIIITGFPDFNTAVESMKDGVFDYLSKSSSNKAIIEVIQKALTVRKKELIKLGQYSSNRTTIKIATICNHSLIVERIKNFANSNPDFKFFHSFENFRKLENTKFLPEINIILICASCCLTDSSEFISFFKKLYHHLPLTLPVIINEKFLEEEKVKLLKVGVKGFFSIDMDSDKLEKALNLINKGEIWANRRLVFKAMQGGVEYYLMNAEDKSQDYALSDREKEILRVMVLGLKNRDIADKLFISELTVKTHINKIFKKLKVKNRVSAILMALDEKLI